VAIVDRWLLFTGQLCDRSYKLWTLRTGGRRSEENFVIKVTNGGPYGTGGRYGQF
jgi:hypothetical protein